MTEFGYAADRAADHVRRAVHKASPFVERFARFGYAAKGVVYITVGLLAVMAAIGSGRVSDSRGAMQTILDQPFGQILLGVVALGLMCYALWQFMRAVEDPESEGSDAKGVMLRIGFFISGVIHAALVIYALHLLMGSRAGSGDDSGAKSWSGWVLSYPAGQLILGLIGAGTVVYGLFQFYKAWTAQLDKQLVLERMSPTGRRWAVDVARFGLAARGIVFGLIGLFLVVAAYQHDPNQARGLGGTLRALQAQPFGPWLLSLVALGLIAYGAYQFIEAKYRRIETK